MKYFIILIFAIILASCTNFNDDKDAVIENQSEIIKDKVYPNLFIPENIGSKWIYSDGDTVEHVKDSKAWMAWNSSLIFFSDAEFLYSHKNNDSTVYCTGFIAHSFKKIYKSSQIWYYEVDTNTIQVFYNDPNDSTFKGNTADTLYKQTIYVKAGKASDCAVFVFNAKNGDTETYYLLQGIGIVKYELKGVNGYIKRSYELVKYIK